MTHFKLRRWRQISRGVRWFFICVSNATVIDREWRESVTQFLIEILPQCWVASGPQWLCGCDFMKPENNSRLTAVENTRDRANTTKKSIYELLMTFHSDRHSQKLLVNIKPLHAAHSESTSDRHHHHLSPRSLRLFCCLTGLFLLFWTSFNFMCCCVCYNEMKIVLFKKTSRLTRDFRLLDK